MKVMNLTRHYSGLAKVTDFTCYNQAINPGFFEYTSILIYMFIYYILYIYIYIYMNSFIAEASQLKDLCWVILGFFGLILRVLLYLSKAVKPFFIKVCWHVFCIDETLATLKIFSQQVLLSWRPFWGYFLVCFELFFSISWRTLGFLWNFAHVFVDNTLMVLRLKNFMRLLPFS